MAVAGSAVRGAVVRRAPAGRPLVKVQAVPVPRLRRCTFRRVIATPARSLTMYEAECTYPDFSAALPLGDLASAQPICAACTLPGVFRPDED